MANSSAMDGAAAGLAALAICESLLLALSDMKIIAERDAANVLDDAAAAHRGGGASAADAAINGRVVALIEQIRVGGNPVLRQ
jgi:hypothetical protein